MSQLFELQPENLNGHGIQWPRPHKSPDKTIIISKEGEKERERGGAAWQRQEPSSLAIPAKCENSVTNCTTSQPLTGFCFAAIKAKTARPAVITYH